MKRTVTDDLNFLKKLDAADRDRFFNMTEEEQERVVMENKLAMQEERFRKHSAGMSQLCDRLSSESFQG